METKAKIKLSHRDYREAVDEAFTANMSNPTVFWNSEDGFYVAPSRDLEPNDDICIGLAYYSLNDDGGRSMSGSRNEYRPIARAIRDIQSGSNDGMTFSDLVSGYEDGIF